MNNIVKSIGIILLTILIITACNPAQNQVQSDQLDQTASFDQVNPYDQVDPYGQYDAFDTYDQNLNRQETPGDQARNGDGIIPPIDQPTPRRGDRNTQGLGGGTKAPQAPNRNQEAQEVAERLVKLATEVDEVNDATAVVAGRWAIVGIDVNAKLDRSKVGSIKYSVAEALKADPKGAYAIVTADIDTNYRLRQMAKEIRQGKPIAGVMEELAAIIGRLMPQVPRQVQDPENSPQEREDQGAGSNPPAKP